MLPIEEPELALALTVDTLDDFPRLKLKRLVLAIDGGIRATVDKAIRGHQILPVAEHGPVGPAAELGCEVFAAHPNTDPLLHVVDVDGPLVALELGVLGEDLGFGQAAHRVVFV